MFYPSMFLSKSPFPVLLLCINQSWDTRYLLVTLNKCQLDHSSFPQQGAYALQNEHLDLTLKKQTNVWSNPSLIFTTIVNFVIFPFNERGLFNILSTEISHVHAQGVGGTFRMMAHFPSILSSCSTLIRERDMQLPSVMWASGCLPMSSGMTWFPRWTKYTGLNLKKITICRGKCDSNFS